DEAVNNNYLAEKEGGFKSDGKIKITKSGEVLDAQYNYIDFYNPEAFDWWKKQIKQAVDLGFKGFKPDAGQSLQKDAVLFGGRKGKDVHNSYATEYNKVFYESL